MAGNIWMFFIYVGSDGMQCHHDAWKRKEWKVPWNMKIIAPWVSNKTELQYIPRNMQTVFALLCFVVVIHWLIFPYSSGLLHRHCGNLTIAPVPAKQPWWIWINTSCEFIMNDCITTTKQSTTKPCAYFLGYIITIKLTLFPSSITTDLLCVASVLSHWLS